MSVAMTIARTERGNLGLVGAWVGDLSVGTPRRRIFWTFPSGVGSRVMICNQFVIFCYSMLSFVLPSVFGDSFRGGFFHTRSLRRAFSITMEQIAQILDPMAIFMDATLAQKQNIPATIDAGMNDMLEMFGAGFYSLGRKCR
jgi:hypothetical protein